MTRKYVLILVLLMCNSAFAWDSLVHRAIADIAAQRLTPQVASQVQALLGSDNFVDSSTWADEVKKGPQWIHTAAYHYASVDDGLSYLNVIATYPPEILAKGDVVMATMKADAVLRDPAASPIAKKYALKMLIHFVSDMSQPLHTGRTADRGGNDEQVSWFGQVTRLHYLWDGKMLETAYASQINPLPRQKQDLWLAAMLSQKYPVQLRAACEIDVGSWFTEAMKARTVSYTGYNGDNTTYMKQSLPVMEAQIMKGALALACTLNSIFQNPTQPSQKEVQTAALISKAIKRDFLQLIVLEPR